MNLHQIYGSRILLHHLGQAYDGYYIVPIVHQNQDGFEAAIFTPDGEDCSYLCKGLVGNTPQLAVEFGKEAVKPISAYWALASEVDEWQEKGLITRSESHCAHSSLED